MTLAGYRPRTISERMTCLRAFTSHTGRSLPLATRQDVEAFLARPLAPESRRAYRSHLRAFYRWAIDEGLLTHDPTEKVPAIRVPRGTPRPIGEAELAYALELAPPRMLAWLLLMALAGLRACEVAALTPRDVIRHDSGALLFLRETKGGGTATVPAHQDVVQALSALPIRDGKWWECQPHTVSMQVSRYLRSLGINATGHQLRHFAGTAWYRSSSHDLLVTAELMRHAQVTTTQTYAALDPARAAAVVGNVPTPRLPPAAAQPA